MTDKMIYQKELDKKGDKLMTIEVRDGVPFLEFGHWSRLARSFVRDRTINLEELRKK